MADAWDPFADPADSISGQAVDSRSVVEEDSFPVPDLTAGGQAEGFFSSEDLLAALRNSSCTNDLDVEPSQHCSPEEFAGLLSGLLEVADHDIAEIESVMQKISAAISLDSSFHTVFVQHTAPLFINVAENSQPDRTNLLNTVLSFLFGFFVKKGFSHSNAVAIARPQSDFSGTAVLVLGWGGSTMSQLDDVEDFYRTTFPGSLIIRLVSSAGVHVNVKGSVGLRGEIVTAISAVLEAWSHTAEGTHQYLLVHLFSNGGMITWTETLDIWQWLSCKTCTDPLIGRPVPPLKSVLRGIILDSAPNDKPIRASLEDIISSVQQNIAPLFYKVLCEDHDGSDRSRKLAESRAVKVRNLALAPNSPIRSFLKTKPERALIQGGIVESRNVHRFEPPVPLLFIYSRTDAVIPYQAVQSYINDVKQRPNREEVMQPLEVVLENSVHIFHKVAYKEMYWSRVKSFTTNVLKP